MTNSTHRVPIVRITDIQKHPGADNLSLVKIGGYQVVVRTEDFKHGELAVYIQPDSIVPERPEYSFLWHPRTFDGPVPEKYRRVTARRFRKEWSEGLLMPFSLISRVPTKGAWLEDMDVANELNITHYEPPEDVQLTGDNERGPGRQNRVWPRSLKGWFWFLYHLVRRDQKLTGGFNETGPEEVRPVYDVEAYKNFVGVIQENEPVMITEKIHGSNARYTFEQSGPSFLNLVLPEIFESGHMYAGSRKLWKKEGNTVWRQVLKQHPGIKQWCQDHPGYTLYGEVVPTQGGFNYECKDGQTRFFLFDIRTPDGKWVDIEDQDRYNVFPYKIEWVPVLYCGPFSEQLITKLVDGPSPAAGNTHLREGIVIRPLRERQERYLGRVQLKVVSNAFLTGGK